MGAKEQGITKKSPEPAGSRPSGIHCLAIATPRVFFCLKHFQRSAFMSDLFRRRTEMTNAAVSYAQQGWHVIPVGAGPDRKLPYIKNWTEEASTDWDTIAGWWSEYPDANIGIVTGGKSGFWVVDVDMKNGVDGLKSLRDKFGTDLDFDSQRYLVGQTATGGFHFLFAWDAALPVRNRQAVLPGVDIRGEGGQIVVAPSSRLINGREVAYQWNDRWLPVSPISPWARMLSGLASSRHTRPVDLVAVMSGLNEGARDTELWRYACHLARRAVPLELALSFMAVAAERCQPPFDAKIARDKVVRAYSTGASNPAISNMISQITNELNRRKEEV
jgi:hypothetical protein